MLAAHEIRVDQCISFATAAKLLDVTRATVHAMVARDELHRISVDGRNHVVMDAAWEREMRRRGRVWRPV